MPDSMSEDHTFDAAKNFLVPPGKPPIKAIWDAATGAFTEPIVAVCTRSTNSNETVHAWEDLIHRDAFDPTVEFSDIFPANEAQMSHLNSLCD